MSLKTTSTHLLNATELEQNPVMSDNLASAASGDGAGGRSSFKKGTQTAGLLVEQNTSNSQETL